MTTARKRTFSLPPEQASYIDTLVASGSFASGSEVVRAGLRALKERDEAIERWLRDEVVPVYDRMTQDPARAVPIAEARERLQSRHRKRLRDKPR